MIDRRTIHKQHYLDCVALVVDINSSEKLIGAGADGLTAQFRIGLLPGGSQTCLDPRPQLAAVATVRTPHKANMVRKPTQDGRPLRRYLKRWKIERTNAWLGNFRHVVVRNDC